MNCFLWLVDYALDKDILTEHMWIFAAYFIMRDHDTHIDFLPLLKCKALHFAADFKRVLGCLISSKCLLDLNNSKPFSFCPWLSLFTAMFCHAGPSSLAFLAGWLILMDSDLQMSKSRRSGLQLKLKLHQLSWRITMWLTVMTALRAMNSKLQLVFLRIMRVFVLERVIAPLVITFELA